MVDFATIILFFIYCWGLGYSSSFFLSLPENRLERNAVRVALGLGVFPILAITLNLLRLPLDWKLFLVLSIAYPLYALISKIRKKGFTSPSFSWKITTSSLALMVVLAIFAFSLFMYTKGAFSYPYLEDEDPWGHAVGAKYVAVEKTAYDPSWSIREGKIDQLLSYIDPYPPAYDVLMGILHQTSENLNWALKFFNALIISLSVVFFYIFAKELMKDQWKAVLATFILASIPAYLSHFIWAHGMGIALFFPLMYCFWKIKEHRAWAIPGALILGSIWVTQNLELPIKLTFLLVVFIVIASITQKRFVKYEIAALGVGLVLSLLWWGGIAVKYSPQGLVKYYTGDDLFENGADAGASGRESSVSVAGKVSALFRSLTSSGGSGSRAYWWNDFFIAHQENAINAPIGIGLVVWALALLGLGYLLWTLRGRIVAEENMWILMTVFWFLFLFWGVNGQTFPISIFRGPFRVWLLLGIPTALLAAESVFVVGRFLRRFQVPLALTVLVIVIGILLTSLAPKYSFNTSMWPTSGSFSSPQDPWDYGLWFGSLEPNTPVFVYAPRDKLVIGYGGYACAWCRDELQFRDDILEKDARTLHSFLKSKGYQFLILNPGMENKYLSPKFGAEAVEKSLPLRYEEIQSSGLFTPVEYKENRFLILRVD